MKLTAVALFGAGYVVGTRAGRERYDQIVAFARKVADRIDEQSKAPESSAAFADRLAERIEASTGLNGHGSDRPLDEALGRQG